MQRETLGQARGLFKECGDQSGAVSGEKGKLLDEWRMASNKRANTEVFGAWSHLLTSKGASWV